MDWVIDELDQFEKRDGDVFLIDEDSKEKLRQIAPFWKNNTVKDRGLAAFPPRARLLYDLGIIKAEGNITSGDAHVAADYTGLLQNGLGFYREKARRKLETLDLTECCRISTRVIFIAA